MDNQTEHSTSVHLESRSFHRATEAAAGIFLVGNIKDHIRLYNWLVTTFVADRQRNSTSRAW